MFQSLAAGNNHTCGLLPDGSVACWGNNTLGALGDGTTVTRLVPAPATQLTGLQFETLVSGDNFTCGQVIGGGAPLCWTRQVILPQVAFVTVTGPTADIAVNGTVQLAATAYDGQEHILTGRTVLWVSGTPNLASVSATGLVTGLAAGSATVYAVVDGVPGTALITVH